MMPFLAGIALFVFGLCLPDHPIPTASTALCLLFLYSLYRWTRPSRGPTTPVNPANLFTLCLGAGLCWFIIQQHFKVDYPIETVNPQRRRCLTRLERIRNHYRMFPPLKPVKLPNYVTVNDGTIPKLKLQGYQTLGLQDHTPARQAIREALRYCRRDQLVMHYALEVAELADQPDLIKQILAVQPKLRQPVPAK